MPTKWSENVTIANTATDSTLVTLREGFVPVALFIPSAITGTTVTFKGSAVAGGTLQTVYSGGSDYTVTIAASKLVELDYNKFLGLAEIQIIAGSAQNADRTIGVLQRLI